MPTPVTTTRYRANDGSMHDTASEANRHEERCAKKRYLDRIIEVVGSPLENAISGEFHNEWRALDEWSRGRVIESVVEALVEHREALVAALVAPLPPPQKASTP